ncbi:MAG: DUF2934 domain-containing protein [Deltaproteobacteria bacterium]|jgi:hypothetical protein|nr:DUF2934 domain-containing protein [Deltaproteobacteria bacterium]
MPGLTEEAIRTRAYLLWKAAGEPAGRMDVFWYAAERELLVERVNGSAVSPTEDRQPISRH